MSDPIESRRTGSPSLAACPICGAPRAAAYAPFCSKRCADVDLHRWLADGYVIPGRPSDEDDV